MFYWCRVTMVVIARKLDAILLDFQKDWSSVAGRAGFFRDCVEHLTTQICDLAPPARGGGGSTHWRWIGREIRDMHPPLQPHSELSIQGDERPSGFWSLHIGRAKPGSQQRWNWPRIFLESFSPVKTCWSLCCDKVTRSRWMDRRLIAWRLLNRNCLRKRDLLDVINMLPATRVNAYQPALRDWCNRLDVDPLSATIGDVLKF